MRVLQAIADAVRHMEELGGMEAGVHLIQEGTSPQLQSQLVLSTWLLAVPATVIPETIAPPDQKGRRAVSALKASQEYPAKTEFPVKMLQTLQTHHSRVVLTVQRDHKDHQGMRDDRA